MRPDPVALLVALVIGVGGLIAGVAYLIRHNRQAVVESIEVSGVARFTVGSGGVLRANGEPGEKRPGCVHAVKFIEVSGHLQNQ